MPIQIIFTSFEIQYTKKAMKNLKIAKISKKIWLDPKIFLSFQPEQMFVKKVKIDNEY